MSSKIKFSLFLIFVGSVFVPLISLANGLVPCGPGTSKPVCELCDFFVMFDRWIDRILFIVIPPVAILMIAIGGFMYIIAYLSPAELLPGGTKGGPKMFSQAKRLLTSVVFGLLIIYGAWLIINTFFQVVGINKFNEFRTLPQNWWIIECP